MRRTILCASAGRRFAPYVLTDLKFVEAPRQSYTTLTRSTRGNKYYCHGTRTYKNFARSWQTCGPGPPRFPPPQQRSPKHVRRIEGFGILDSCGLRNVDQLAEPSLLPDPKDKIEEQNLLHRAMIAAEDGRSAEARAALEEIVRSIPNSHRTRSIGSARIAGGRIFQGSSSPHSGEAVAPHGLNSCIRAGRASEGNGDLSGAKEALEASLKLNPTYFQARLLLGKIDLELKELKAAEDDFESRAPASAGKQGSPVGQS